MFSSRYAPVVLVLVALAAIPTVMHGYIDSTATDGRAVRSLPMELAGRAGVPTTRRATWGEDRFGSSDWIERRYGGPPAATLFVGRTFDPKRLYHHPELAVDYGPTYEPATTVRFAQRPDVPIHLLRTADIAKPRVAMYTLHYRDRYIDDPIRFQLRTSLELLLTRRRQLTLFFAAQDLRPSETPESSSAASLLLAAMAAFERQRAPAE